MNQYKRTIADKLRLCGEEFGFSNIKFDVIIVGPADYTEIAGYKYITAPTLSTTVLANVDWKIARFFEDI